MTVQQLYLRDMQVVSTFAVPAMYPILNSLYSLRQAMATRGYGLVCIGCDVLEKDEDAVGRTRDQRQV
jgi:hypothetical protein